MKKIIFSTLLLTLICNLFFTQSVPQSINYQAIAHDNNGSPLVNKNIIVRIKIISDAINGQLEWEEDHSITTNDYGLFYLKIGNGNSTNAGNQSSFSNVPWKNHQHFLKIQVDEGFGFEDLGTQQLVSVPYSFHALTVENDEVNDADADSGNELITNTNLNNTSIEITEGAITHSIDLNPLLGASNDSDWLATNNGATTIIYNTNDRVGIGTNSPSEKLHIKNGSIRIDDGTNPYTLPSTDGSANQVMSTDGTGNLSWQNSSTDTDWIINNNDMYSGVTGKVGIGTSPLAKFHVDLANGEGITQTDDVIINKNATSTDAVSLNLISGSVGQANLSFGDNSNSYSGRVRYNNQSNSMDFWTNNTPNRILINSSGYVGINNSSPSAYLDVVGSFQYDDGNQQNNFILKTDANGNASWVDPTTIATADDGDWNINGTHLESGNSGNVGIGPMHSTIGGPGYFLNSGKALTIATTDSYNTQPPAVIELVSSSATGTDIMGRIAFGHVLNAPTTPIYLGGIEMNKLGDMMFSTNGNNESFRINSSGNVGIGTNAPFSKLHVNGNQPTLTITHQGALTSAGSAIGYIKFFDSQSSSFPQSAILSQRDGTSSSSTDLPTNLLFYTTADGSSISLERMRINNAGYVGIGTSSPDQKLHVANGNINIDLNYNYEIGDEIVVSRSSTNVTLGSNLVTDLALRAGTEKMRIKTDGKVGIGTTSPVNTLDIEGGMAIGTSYSGSSTAPTNGLLIEGNVGIGTSAPSANLDVVGTIQLDDGNQGAGKILTSDASGNATWASNSIYTESASLNNFSINATTYWQQTGASFNVNKVYADSKIEVTFNSRIYAGLFNGTSGVLFEIRVDGVSADYDNIGAITTSGSIEFISMFAVFSGLSTGNHTIEVYARTYSGSTSNTLIDTGGWGGKMIAKETF